MIYNLTLDCAIYSRYTIILYIKFLIMILII
jgi:hypothetical protein